MFLIQYEMGGTKKKEALHYVNMCVCQWARTVKYVLL